MTERLYPDHPVGQHRGLSQIGRIVADHDIIIKPIVFDEEGTLESRSGWDAISSYIVMNHNVHVMLEAMKYGHQAFDKGWENVPTSVIQIEIAINHLFDAADPYSELENWAPILQDYATD